MFMEEPERHEFIARYERNYSTWPSQDFAKIKIPAPPSGHNWEYSIKHNSLVIQECSECSLCIYPSITIHEFDRILVWISYNKISLGNIPISLDCLKIKKLIQMRKALL